MSAFTWLTTPDACWSNADRCALRLAAAFETSLARVEAEESTCSRRELLVGFASREEKELKKPVMSLPMSPAVELAEPEAGVKSAWTVLSAARREPEARGQLLLLIEPFFEDAVPLGGCAGLRDSRYRPTFR